MRKQAARFPEPQTQIQTQTQTQTRQKNIGAIHSVLPGADDSELRICWRFKHVDNDSPWGIDCLTAAEMAALMAKLMEFESQTLLQLFSNGDEPGKHYHADQLPNPTAHDRLTAMKLADMTRISRLRLGGTKRLYGFLLGNVFHVLWWDQKHEVWPSVKKHT